MINRRNVIRGLLAAPVVITTPGLLMPVKAMHHPRDVFIKVTGTVGEVTFCGVHIGPSRWVRVVHDTMEDD